jgi:DNA-directed RNA polymerase specialized sigma24 family protein
MDTPTDDTDQQIKQQVMDMIQKVGSAFAGIPDPTNRAKAIGAMLDAMPQLQAGLRELRQNAVKELRAGGMSHGEVAAALGISRSRAQQIAEGRASGRATAKG